MYNGLLVSPFQTFLFGIPITQIHLVRARIREFEPYDVTLEILNTKEWADNGLVNVYIQVIDAIGTAGNVTIQTSYDQCQKGSVRN